MLWLRTCLTACVVLCLLAGTFAAGMARGAMAAEGQLCSITGPAPLVLAHDGLPLLDGDGEPVVLNRDLCVDCLFTPVVVPADTPVPLRVDGREAVLTGVTAEAAIAPDWWMGGYGRGPPA